MLLEVVSIGFLSVLIATIGIWFFKSSSQTEPEAPRRGLNRMQLNPEEEEQEEQKMTEKEAKKAQKKEERKAQREARQAVVDQKEKKRQDREAKWLEREKEWEQKEAEEEAKRKAEEEAKQKAQEEEYMKWKDMFQVEDEGEELQEGSYDLNRFLEYIKLRKVVMIEDIGAEFGLEGKSVVERLQDLENSGYLTGIVDDRGKYIYLTEEELLGVKAYIENRGRVTRMELSQEGNRLIRLEPTQEDKLKIEQEEKSLAQNLDEEEHNG